MIMGLAFVMLFPLMGFVGCDSGTDYELLGRIEALERETEELRKEAEREAERVSGLEAEIETLNKQVENLTGQLYSLTGQLNKLVGLLGEQAEIVLSLGETIEELEGTISSLNRQIEILKRELWGIVPFWRFFPGWERDEKYHNSLSIISGFLWYLQRPLTVLIRSTDELIQLFAESNIYLFDENSPHYNNISFSLIREFFNDEFFSEYMFLWHLSHCERGRQGNYIAFNATIKDEVIILHCRFFFNSPNIISDALRMNFYTFRQEDVVNITSVQFNDYDQFGNPRILI